MENSRELKEQRGLLHDELNAFDALLEAKKPLTEEQDKRFSEITEQLPALNKKIEDAEKRELLLAEARNSKTGAPAIIAKIGDNEDDVRKNFRYSEMILQAADPRGLEGFYKEIAQEGVKDLYDSTGRSLGKGEIAVPTFINTSKRTDEKEARRIVNEKRALSTGTGSSPYGGYTIQTDLLENEFIDVLANKLVFTQMGAKFLSGLKGPVSIPKRTANSGASWTAEGSAVSVADQVFGQLSLSAKKLSNGTIFSRELLGQSAMSVEMLVREDLINSQLLAVESAAINGTGSSNQPTGILATFGIGSVAIGTNGGAPTLASIVTLETEVAQDNADFGNLQYLTNAKVRGKMKQVVKDSGSGIYLWDDRNGATPINGYGTMVTNMIPSNLTKGTSSGVCSAILFGNWADLIIAQWGGLVLTVNPYSLDVNAQIRVVSHGFYDIGVRQASSFAACVDYTTT